MANQVLFLSLNRKDLDLGNSRDNGLNGQVFLNVFVNNYLQMAEPF